MKRFLFSILALVCCLMGVNAQQTWDFSAPLSASDEAALSGDNTNWSYTAASNRYENVKAIDGDVKAGGSILQLTSGLKFTAPEKKLRIDVGKRVQLAGKKVVITIPNLKKGQVVKVSLASTGDTPATLDNVTNLDNVSGFVAANKNTTQEGKGTVAADGEVSLFSNSGSLNIFSITVGDAEETPTDDPVGDDTHNVAMNALKNQVVLTLNDGTKKYYNTEDLASIDFDEAEGTVEMVQRATDGWTDTYTKQVADLSFAKAVEAGEQGEYSNTQGKVEIIESKGWLESAYVKFALFSGATSYHVYVKGGQYADYTKIDGQLVRNYGTYGRADVVGLRTGAYALKVVPVVDDQEQTAAANEVTALKVEPYKREGFAFMNGYQPGAYKADGTLKAGAVVVYVTSNNAKTVTAKLSTGTVTGIQAILKAYEKKVGQRPSNPLVVRFIGTINAADVDYFESSEEGLQVKGAEKPSELNMTFEGIGEDATIKGFGFLVRNSKSIEFRNFAIIRCMDDGLSLDTDNSNIWIHHLDVFYGKHGSGDHEKGDGAIDVKSDSKYVTMSYCHEWDTGKSNMFGMKSESGENWISYDHNWFDHSDSRHPRVRTMSVHVWNNFFDNVAKYGVGATSGSSVFVENNYFLNTKKPILASSQGTDALGSGTFSGEDGGMIKAYGNYFDRSAKNFRYYTQANPATTGYDAYETATRDAQVPSTEKTRQGGTSYNNFDTDASKMYAYEPDDAADVPSVVMGYYGAGRLNHGDIQYTFKDNVGSDDDDSAYDTKLGALLDGYKSALVGIFGDENASSGEQGGEGGEGGGEQGGEGGQEQPEGTIGCSFDKSGTPSSSFFEVSGNGSNSKGSVTVDGVVYSECLKMESATSVKFTLSKPMTMTLYFGSTETASIKINDKSISGSGSTYTQTLDAGSYVLTKDKSVNLFYIKLVPVE